MIFYYLIFVNIIAFIMYAIDKRKAIKNKWRISEFTLLMIAFVGGSIGALLGMYGLRHKTKHWKFKIFVPLFIVLHVFLIIKFFILG